MEEIQKKKKRIDYKWVIAALSCFMVFVVLGFCSSPRTIFTVPICDALNLSRSVFSFNLSTRYIATAITNIFFGALIYRFGAKKLILFGFASLTVSMLIYSLASNVIGFCVGGVFLGIGLSFTTTTMVGAVVNKWFSKNKGTIMGIALASNGLGAALAVKILSPIIYAEGDFSYRNAYRLVAVIVLLAAVLIFIFFKDSPKSEKAGKTTEKYQKVSKNYSAILKTAYLYPAAICIFCAGLVLQSVYEIAAPIFTDSGIHSDQVSNILSLSSLFLFCTKFGVGFIYDHTGVRRTSSICYLSSVVAIVFLVLVSFSGNSAFAYIYTIFAALALPLETIMLPIFARELFGEKHFNEALGIFVSVNTAGYAVGAPLANLCYDLLGNYNLTLYLSVGIMIVAFIALNVVISVSKKALIAKEK